ncbi:uncharacterized protein LY89DRAFT_686520 [Mollisia scopiformis]|uniref:Uncharacterized protein n=1 Tax=Mollisia scopiformis TaxID=149040 RepID=A0A194X4E2_MOLSC|nr:uncharacterized protein LY89DRAFT_686520 [Mollisia scopiformis]KUJ14924.1 hypothetical protein LY89DRAFT_686520 [Mollisia scopiformis]
MSFRMRRCSLSLRCSPQSSAPIRIVRDRHPQKGHMAHDGRISLGILKSFYPSESNIALISERLEKFAAQQAKFDIHFNYPFIERIAHSRQTSSKYVMKFDLLSPFLKTLRADLGDLLGDTLTYQSFGGRKKPFPHPIVPFNQNAWIGHWGKPLNPRPRLSLGGVVTREEAEAELRYPQQLDPKDLGPLEARVLGEGENDYWSFPTFPFLGTSQDDEP